MPVSSLILSLALFSLVPTAANASSQSSNRIFCESDDKSLPYLKFDFFPNGRGGPDNEGKALLSIDKGRVLDINTYNNVKFTIDDNQAKIDYAAGRIVFDLSDDFEHSGSIKHFLTGGILKEIVTCYFLTGNH